MISSIEYMGFDSFHDFNMTIKSKSLPAPQKLELLETVPFMHGSYDFSSIAGNAIYSDRVLTYKFNLICQSKRDLNYARQEISKWLLPNNDWLPLRDSDIDDLHFVAKCRSLNFEEDGCRMTVAVVFAAKPFMTNGGQDITLLSTSAIATYMLYRTESGADVAEVSSSKYVYNIPSIAIKVDGDTGTVSAMTLTAQQKVHFRIKGNKLLKHVQLLCEDDSKQITIEPVFIDTKNYIFDFYWHNQAGKLTFDFVFTQAISAAGEAVGSIVGRNVTTVAVEASDVNLPLTAVTNGDSGSEITYKDATYIASANDKTALFCITGGHNLIKVTPNGSCTTTLKYLTLEEAL